MPATHFITVSGDIKVPGDLEDQLTQLAEIVPNTWNPNKMDTSMSEKLERSIKKDGFTTPVLVRPLPKARKGDVGDEVNWEIVDGEHRWKAAEKLGMTEVPIVNLGDISDEAAKQITIKANALRGEFDSVDLAQMVKDLSESTGLSELEKDLPYTAERLTAFVELLSTDVSGALNLGDNDAKGDGEKPNEGEEQNADGDSLKDQFKSFDGSEMQFDHKCPRCGFEFNAEKDAK